MKSGIYQRLMEKELEEKGFIPVSEYRDKKEEGLFSPPHFWQVLLVMFGLPTVIFIVQFIGFLTAFIK